MATPAMRLMTPEEYLALERQSETKNEFYEGQVFAMAGTSVRHVRICSNILTALGNSLSGSDCWAGSADLRVRTPETKFYTYPDVVIACGDPEVEDEVEDTLLDPVAIFEVLSKSTEKYDRGQKFALYRRIESLKHYVLVSQDRQLVEHYRKSKSGEWILRELPAQGNQIEFDDLAISLSIPDIYSKIRIGPPPALHDDPPVTA